MSQPQRRIRVQWTATALKCLKELPQKVQRGLLDKADGLSTATDPRQVYKPLAGVLEGYYRITYARYRAVYRVDEEELANGNVLVTIVVTFIAAGKREERSKHDIYKVAEKLVEMGVLDTEKDDPKKP